MITNTKLDAEVSRKEKEKNKKSYSFLNRQEGGQESRFQIGAKDVLRKESMQLQIHANNQSSSYESLLNLTSWKD